MKYDAKFIMDNYATIVELDKKRKYGEILKLVYPNGIDTKMHHIDDESFEILLVDELLMKMQQIKVSYESLGKYINLHDTLFIRCPTCGKPLWLHSASDGTCVLYDKDKLPNHILKHLENKECDMYSCFDLTKPIEYKFKTKSDKFVIANDLRNLMPVDFMDGHSINNNLGIHEMTTEFAKNNMFIGYVGNTTCEVGKTDDGKIIIVNGILDEFHYDEKDEDETQEFFDWLEENYFCSDKYFSDVKPIIDLNYKNVGRISCALWWVMGMDASIIDINQIKTDYTVVDVEPNTEYKFTVDYKRAGNNSFYHYSIEKV